MVEEKLQNGSDDDPKTLLEIAVRDGRVDILRSLLQQLGKLKLLIIRVYITQCYFSKRTTFC